MPSLLKEQRGRRKGGLKKENNKPQLFTKEIMLLLAWATIKEENCYMAGLAVLPPFPFQKEKIKP